MRRSGSLESAALTVVLVAGTRSRSTACARWWPAVPSIFRSSKRASLQQPVQTRVTCAPYLTWAADAVTSPLLAVADDGGAVPPAAGAPHPQPHAHRQLHPLCRRRGVLLPAQNRGAGAVVAQQDQLRGRLQAQVRSTLRCGLGSGWTAFGQVLGVRRGRKMWCGQVHG